MDAAKEVLIMQNIMTYRGITRYSYTYIRPTIFKRFIRFMKAALELKPAGELPDAMQARLYL